MKRGFELDRSHSFTGLSVRAKFGVMLRLHFVALPYKAFIHESNDSLSVKPFVLALHFCLRCVTRKHGMDQHCQYPLKTVNDKLHIRSAFQCHKMKMRAHDMDERFSIRIVQRTFSDLPFVDIYYQKNAYLIFCFERTHNPFSENTGPSR